MSNEQEINVPAIRGEDWYGALVDDCQTIIVERGFNARWEVIQAKHEIGSRIATDTEYDKFRGTSEGRAIIIQLSKDIQWSAKEIYLCIQFFEKYPEFTQACETLPEGKAISWHKIANNYLADKPRQGLARPVKLGQVGDEDVVAQEQLRIALERRIRDSIDEATDAISPANSIEIIVNDIIDFADEYLFPKMRRR